MSQVLANNYLLHASFSVSGYKQFAGDIEVMLGHKPSYYYMVTWYGITPITILVSSNAIRGRAI